VSEFLRLPRTDQIAIIQKGAESTGRRPEYLEKDVWICWALQCLFDLPDSPSMVFKGGTSLSKVYGAIKRFSEDVDITIDYAKFAEGLNPFLANLSRNRCDQIGKNIRKNLKKYVDDFILPHFTILASELGCKVDRPQNADANERLTLHYPSCISAVITETVILEFGARNTVEPHDSYTLRPYLSDLIKVVDFPVANVTVLSPKKTFWEKATLIHHECNRWKSRQPKPNADRMVRHWCDLAILADHDIGESALVDLELLKDVIQVKKIFYRSTYSQYDDCTSGKFCLVPTETLRDLLRSDYSNMIRDGMFEEAPMPFESVMGRIAALEKMVNGSCAQLSI